MTRRGPSSEPRPSAGARRRAACEASAPRCRTRPRALRAACRGTTRCPTRARPCARSAGESPPSPSGHRGPGRRGERRSLRKG
eukprot:3781676-Pleurochrysis_carterae.AAC.1